MGPVFLQKNRELAWGADFQGDFLNRIQRVKDCRIGVVDNNVNVLDE